MTVTADDHFGGFDHSAGDGGKAVHAVFADADDMQPRSVNHWAAPLKTAYGNRMETIWKPYGSSYGWAR